MANGQAFNSLLVSQDIVQPLTQPVVAQTQPKKDNTSMIGSIVNTTGGLIAGFNYKQQENEIELARINAEAAKANADASANTSNKKYIYIAVGVIVLIVLVVLLKPKS